MKSYITLIFTLLLFVSCSIENEPSFTPQTEADILQYIEDNNLTATKTDSGLYYVINNEGTGTRPTENSVVNITYEGYFLDGTIFEQSESGAILELTEVINGLKEGLQLFKEGGDGILLIPSDLAYGANGYNSIPGGAVLVLNIKLTEGDYAAQNEIDILKYIEDNNLSATKTDSGLYYIINNEGTGTRPTNMNNVTVAYKGYFLDGTVFDESSSNGVAFGLNQVIKGWTEGIQLFKEGGDGVLLIPYQLGYGVYGSSSIPGCEVLAFDVKLISVN
ncbi:hypothetical protein BTO04_06870 [Polaribacter sp. SA4-10]|uniref:FKBP-type peptidyl-prolyl cis-trans isomerase n=1 Tax=Polaribacter sp. SA4-10 TaxID=754397 RepID=UPI000B3C69C6|nr:FKBP-type peptidyl-prolyl cis-trans isomerase [Polaribacter sp. SA4-10]ARV06436.1 hypothetical protein BTO04_06870 [Polaribacter sp. SA4-10]